MSTVEVYGPEYRASYAVPQHYISHMPPAKLNITRLMICRNYSAAVENGAPREGACRMGSRCKFVHVEVPLSSLRSENIHVHYVWRHESLVTYERMSGQTSLPAEMVVCGPNGRGPTDRVPFSHLLRTKGAVEGLRGLSEGRKTHLSHCAHYFFNQMCNRGDECSFAHVVTVDPRQVAPFTRPSNFHRRLAQLDESTESTDSTTNVSPANCDDHEHSTHSVGCACDLTDAASDTATDGGDVCEMEVAPAAPVRFAHNPYAISLAMPWMASGF